MTRPRRAAAAHVPALLLLTLLAASCDSRERSTRGPPPHPEPTADRRCRDHLECGPTEYCEHDLGLCGRGAKTGTCRARPTGCGSAYSPVCGCDRKAYANECSAHAAGVDLAALGGCAAVIPDWAPCGKRYCNARTSYCEIYLSDVLEPPTDYFCRDLPESCRPDGGAARTCDCFPAGARCRSFCGPLPTGGLDAFHLTCQGVKAPPM